jgi:3-hydroxyisobutyrate dehydrogenase
MENKILKVGFIGVGVMGREMSINLLKAGYELTVYDIREEALEGPIRFGARAAGSPKEIAQVSDIIITSLPNPEALEEVVLGNDGVLEGARRGCILIDTSTVSPSTIRKVASAVKDRGVDVLDAPVSGGVSGAKAGALSVMVGGDVDVFERCLEVLRVFGKNIYHVGELGSGDTVKLVNNLMSLVNVVTLSEGMVLGVKAGVNPKTLYNVCKVSTGRSQALEWKLPNKISKGRFEPGFTIDLTCKDLGLILAFGREIGVPLFVTSIAQQVYELAKAKGLGRLDNTAVITLFEEAAQVKVRY